MIYEALVALQCDLPFRLAYKRIRHIKHGHNFEMSDVIEDHWFEKHPQNDGELVFKSKLMYCRDCGLHFVDSGFGFRDTNFMDHK